MEKNQSYETVYRLKNFVEDLNYLIDIILKLKLIWMLEGKNYLHAKFPINILKNKKVIKLLEHGQLWLMKKEKQEYRIQ